MGFFAMLDRQRFWNMNLKCQVPAMLLHRHSDLVGGETVRNSKDPAEQPGLVWRSQSTRFDDPKSWLTEMVQVKDLNQGLVQGFNRLWRFDPHPGLTSIFLFYWTLHGHLKRKNTPRRALCSRCDLGVPKRSLIPGAITKAHRYSFSAIATKKINFLNLLD